MPAAAPRNVHHAIQTRVGRFDDLLPIAFHSLWGHNPAQFVQNRMIGQRVIDPPDYYFSPSTSRMLGLWSFNIAQPVQDTALFTLLDDVTAELASRLMAMKPKDRPRIGFTVNLNILKHTISPSASLFYFESRPTLTTDRKVVIECPLFDAHTGSLLLVARATFVFVFAPVPGKAEAAAGNSAQASADTIDPASLLPGLDATDSGPLSNADLDQLSQVMSFLPHGTALHRAGLQSLANRRLVSVFDFSPDLSGPPIYVHGGLLGAVLYNASEMLLAKVFATDTASAVASTRDINYLKGFPLACKSVVVDAVVESIDTESGNAVVFAKLMLGPTTHTTLKTTFELPKTPSRL
ncbi:hypothetical protein H4R99_008387 [Coemansia sp. RSA 1722]|nr:hypothetical protein IWW45_008789 [Coemansia sp. RSA 485]KAJ2586670.1 hypothetical protein H4R99_008387 [Coemansia sp. RSA 1722]